MSNGRYCLIRDLGPVKGGKGLKHHEVILELSWRGFFRFAATIAAGRTDGKTDQEPDTQPQATLSST